MRRLWDEFIEDPIGSLFLIFIFLFIAISLGGLLALFLKATIQAMKS